MTIEAVFESGEGVYTGLRAVCTYLIRPGKGGRVCFVKFDIGQRFSETFRLDASMIVQWGVGMTLYDALDIAVG
jgi:hypothetical protein